MLKHYIKTSFRNFIKNKSFFIINVSGLAIGMACIILIFLWVGDELSYDKFHIDADDLYRVVYFNDAEKTVATHSALAEVLKKRLPEVITTARVRKSSRLEVQAISSNNSAKRIFYEDRIIYAEPELLDIFKYKFLKGDKSTALNEPLDMVITERAAKKYFGNEDPIGKVLRVNDQLNTTVKGVIENVPYNTHLKFDFIFSFSILKMMGLDLNNWDKIEYFTYLKLIKNVDYDKISDKVINLIDNYKENNTYKIYLQPVKDAYLKSNYKSDFTGLGDIKYTYIFTITAFFILLIACINFINLSTAQYLPRSKEVGLRKIVGARKWQLIFQYLNESIIVCFLAMVFAVLVVKILLPEFNNFTGKNLEFNIVDLQIFLGLVGIVFITGIMGGLYPAVFISSFTPANILRGSTNVYANTKNISKYSLRKGLVVVQFTVSVVLIIGSTVIYNQLDYIKSLKLGFEKDNIIFMPVGTAGKNFNSLKEELLKYHDVKGIAVSEYITTNTGLETGDVDWEGKDALLELKVRYKAISYDYLNLLGLKITEGRNFSKDFPIDFESSYIVNEEFVTQSKIVNPIGKRLEINGRAGNIIAVIDNVYYKSLHNAIEPQVHNLLVDLTTHDAEINGVIYIKIGGGSIPQTLSAIVDVWEKIVPASPADYYFLDEEYDKLYKSEQIMGNLSLYFTILGILIACLGLYGLTAYIIEQRNKEIAIRKVLGASQTEILFNLSKEFFVWVLTAIGIGWPFAYFAMNSWLENFAYKIDMDWKVFIFSGLVVAFIALLTLSYHIINASRTNPATALKYE